MDTNTGIHIIKSRRKTISIEITKDLEIIVKAPIQLSNEQILEFIAKKRSWIEKHLEMVRQRNEEVQQIPKFTPEEIRSLADKALAIIPERVAYYAKIIGVTYGRITIRNQVSRWGSCSSKGNLNFNCLLMLTPPEVIDYVVVHELCHRKEMNHSQRFWNEVRKVLPDYEAQKKWLKENGGELIDRMR